MSKAPGIEQTLNLLQALRETVREFAAEEARLREATRRKAGFDASRREAAATSARNRLALDLDEVGVQLRARRARIEGRHRARTTRIRAAERSARKAALGRIEAIEGRRKFELQRDMLRTTKDRDTALAAAEAAFAEFRAGLAARREELSGLEREAREACGVFGRAFGLEGGIRPETPTREAVSTRASELELAEALGDTIAATRNEVTHFRGRLIRRVMALWPLLLLLILVPLPLVPALHYAGVTAFSYAEAGMLALVFAVASVLCYGVGRRVLAPSGLRIARGLERATELHDACLAASEDVRRGKLEQITGIHDTAAHEATATWNQAVNEAASQREDWPAQVAARAARALARNERQLAAALGQADRDEGALLERRRSEADARERATSLETASLRSQLESEANAEWQALSDRWRQRMGPLLERVAAANATPSALAPSWDAPKWKDWTPPPIARPALRFGHLDADLRPIAGALTEETRLDPALPAQVRLPLTLSLPEEGSLVIETRRSGRDGALAAFNQIILRILATMPPGRAAFTLLDPVGLGQSFAGLMHLTDEAEHLIGGRIWTQPGQIEEQLAILNEHMERVIQMYLRNEYADITAYNEQAGSIAEKTRFLVVADFPAGFSDLALKRCLALAKNGARCGVHLLLHWNHQQPEPADLRAVDLAGHAVHLDLDSDRPRINGRLVEDSRLVLEAGPHAEIANAFLQRVARASVDSNRVEVPFSQIAPAPDALWTLETSGEIRVPIGRTAATKVQYLALGKGTRQHALVAGKTGSGKSTLFHVIITNLGLWCSPSEVEFYLVDFKKGVEFKCYATHRLPHARVVAIASDREFGLSVLQHVGEELGRRGDLFRARGVQDLDGYRKSGVETPLPRVLLLIDEFQEFFIEEDRIAQGAAVLLDRIVRQGRAFGIHVILGSQTLGGAHTVARSTLGQMVVRVALQCNEADAYLIMDEDNPAPRLLSRPGEAIYNDASGAREANSPFQVVWLPDEVRDQQLRIIRARADGDVDADAPAHPGPMVFEGDAPADVRENAPMQSLLASGALTPTDTPRIWLGSPNSIKGPTEAIFQRRSADHLLMVGQREDAMTALVVVALLSLAAQHRRGTVRFVILDSGPPDGTAGRLLARLARELPHEILLARPSELESVMAQVHGLLAAASGQTPGTAKASPSTFLFVNGLQSFRLLRQDDEFGFGTEAGSLPPSAQWRELIRDGSAAGIHVVATCDSYSNVVRHAGRNRLGDFGFRVLFQMSANDSASLIDNPGASRLGLHRALLHRESEGSFELFRPYALPDGAWMETAIQQVKRLAG